MPALQLSRSALQFFATLPAKQFRQVVVRVLALSRDPQPHNSQALEGIDARRIHIGEYRVIYRVEGGLVHVLHAGKRNDDEVYRGIG